MISSKPSLLILAACGLLSAIAFDRTPAQGQTVSFLCTVTTDQIPTTIAQTPGGPVDVFKWQSTYFRPPYTPMQRCQEVSQRMNTFQAQGQLDSLTSGRVNKQPVICAGVRCYADGSNVLITLRRDQNPNQVLQEIEANRAGAAGPSRQLNSSGSARRSSNLLTENSDGTLTLNLKGYLGLSSNGSTPNSTQPTNSPIFRNNPTPAVPSTPSRPARGVW